MTRLVKLVEIGLDIGENFEFVVQELDVGSGEKIIKYQKLFRFNEEFL